MIRRLISDKVSLALIIIILIVALSSVTLSIITRDSEKKNLSLKSQLTTITSLSEGLFQLKSTVAVKEKKIGLTNSSGVVSILENILKELGLEASVIKPLEKRAVKDFMEEDVELEIKGLDLNSIVNLLYRVENTPKPMKIKSAFIKTSFDDPDRFMLKLTASVISRQ